MVHLASFSQCLYVYGPITTTPPLVLLLCVSFFLIVLPKHTQHAVNPPTHSLADHIPKRVDCGSVASLQEMLPLKVLGYAC